MTKKSPSSDDIHAALEQYGNKEGFTDSLSQPQIETSDSIDRKGSDHCNSSDDTEECSMSKSTATSYRDEWIRMFECEHFDSYIRREAMKGRLRNCSFRSLCWRVFLKCLSTNVSTWSTEIKASRKKYDDLLHKTLNSTEIKLKDESIDVSLNNPLCQSEDSPWQRFFEDKKNKGLIQQDIDRCFQEIALFQKQSMQDMLLNILFCYAKENPVVDYKQGMHEILAILVFVLHSDHQAYLHAKELESNLIVGPDTRPLVNEMMDPKYLEHDSYTMFSSVMETMAPWYQFNVQNSKPEVLHPTPFAVEEEALFLTTPLAIKIAMIHDVILQKNDFELYTHLTRLEIPQIYGIKWVRLLFCREFMFHDILALWDALFADSAVLDLIDYIFVAMMMLVRELLLRADHLKCLEILMHFPTTGDIHFLINKALHLRDPQNHSRPNNYQFQIFHQSRTGDYMGHTLPKRQGKPSNQPNNSLLDMTNAAVTSGFNSLKRIKKSTTNSKTKDERTNRLVKSNTDGDLPHPLFQSPEEKVVVERKPLPKTNDISSASPVNSEPLTSRVESFFGKPRSNSKKHQEKVGNDTQKEVNVLSTRINDTQNMCKYCATKMEAHLLQIQDAIENHKLPEEDSLLMALAGLKQVRDILSGTLKFAQGIEEDQINISDNYFSEENDSDVSVKHFDKSRETFLAKEDAEDEVSDNKHYSKNNGHVNKAGDGKPELADPLLEN